MVHIEPELRNLLPHLILGGMVTEVVVGQASAGLAGAMGAEVERLAAALNPEIIRELPAVKANREAYRILGKDPARYRPAAEALLRRVASGKGLYAVNNVVDVLNIVSVQTGFSICGYDFDRIEGPITLGVAVEGEPYEGIGRGELNIACLPVFRDARGAFGTPTSDSVRTSVTHSTRRFLMVVIGWNRPGEVVAALQKAKQLLALHAEGQCVEEFLIEASK